MPYQHVRLCSGGGAYEAIPRPKLALDLAKLRLRLIRAGVRVIDARVMLILQMVPEVTLSRDGRILIKSRDEAAAQSTFDRLRIILDLPVAGPSA
jgi:hypothetical protein